MANDPPDKFMETSGDIFNQKNQSNMQLGDIIGKQFYFVHKGTWKTEYEWRIEKVTVTGVKIDEKGKLFVEFSFDCVGYNYSFSYLKNTLKEAKAFAIQQIYAEKKKQISSISKIK